MVCKDSRGKVINAGDGVNIKKGLGRGTYPYMVKTVTGATFTDTTKDKPRQCNQYTLEPRPIHSHTASGVGRTTVPRTAARKLAPHELNQSVEHITSLLQPLLTMSEDMSSRARTGERTRIIVKIGDKINGDSTKFKISETELVKQYCEEMGTQDKAMRTKYKDLFNENYVAVRYDGKQCPGGKKVNGGGIKNKKRKKRKNKSNYKNTKRKNTKRKKKSNYKNSF